MQPRNVDELQTAFAAHEINVSRETARRWLTYHTLLVQWQPKINLISPATLPHAWERHFLDSAQLLKYIDAAQVRHMTDLGSGGGFPGMVLALALPDTHVTFVESDVRKCAFLQTVARENGIKITISNKRIEQHTWGDTELITARALAALPVLCTYVERGFKANPDAAALFLKGERWREEAADAPPMFHVEHHPSITDDQGAILRLTYGKSA